MDTEETEGYVLRRRPYIQLEVGIVLCLVSLGLGEEKGIKKKQPTSHDVATGILAK